MEIDWDLAQKVVAVGARFDAYVRSPDETDDDVLAAAKMLVDSAIEFTSTGADSVNPCALELMHVVGVLPESAVSRAAYEQAFGAVAAPSDDGASPADDKPEAGPAFSDPAQPEPVDIEAIFPGYDDCKVADVKREILAAAASGDLTPEEWEQIKAYEASKEERKTILSLEPEFKAPEAPESLAPAAEPEQASPRASEGDDAVESYYDGTAVTLAQQEGLPIPQHVAAGEAFLPILITDTSDQELSRIASTFNSLFARTQWLISQEEGRAVAAEHLAQEAHRVAFGEAVAYRENSIPEDKRSAAALENARRQAGHDADAAQPVVEWRRRHVLHAAQARELKALASGYDKSVWRVDAELNRRARLATTGTAAPR
jgi:hypothetical protein